MSQIPQIKRCERCYIIISDASRADWYSHIRIKYCDECREIVRREKAAARVKQLRERKRENEKLTKAKIKNLELENEILRKKLEIMWDAGRA
ncbi:MAG: hypothetical protein MJZ03_05390 [archaeon]|nr:hypothetical protein [archaeon]